MSSRIACEWLLMIWEKRFLRELMHCLWQRPSKTHRFPCQCCSRTNLVTTLSSMLSIWQTRLANASYEIVSTRQLMKALSFDLTTTPSMSTLWCMLTLSASVLIVLVELKMTHPKWLKSLHSLKSTLVRHKSSAISSSGWKLERK